jgi:hypothetical protein
MLITANIHQLLTETPATTVADSSCEFVVMSDERGPNYHQALARRCAR